MLILAGITFAFGLNFFAGANVNAPSRGAGCALLGVAFSVLIGTIERSSREP